MHLCASLLTPEAVCLVVPPEADTREPLERIVARAQLLVRHIHEWRAHGLATACMSLPPSSMNSNPVATSCRSWQARTCA